MPDGTRIGAFPMIGGPPTPEGPERLGKALSEAQDLARSRGTGAR
jgi:hypothetical protein